MTAYTPSLNTLSSNRRLSHRSWHSSLATSGTISCKIVPIQLITTTLLTKKRSLRAVKVEISISLTSALITALMSLLKVNRLTGSIAKARLQKKLSSITAASTCPNLSGAHLLSRLWDRVVTMLASPFQIGMTNPVTCRK